MNYKLYVPKEMRIEVQEKALKMKCRNVMGEAYIQSHPNMSPFIYIKENTITGANYTHYRASGLPEITVDKFMALPEPGKVPWRMKALARIVNTKEHNVIRYEEMEWNQINYHYITDGEEGRFEIGYLDPDTYEVTRIEKL